MGFDFTIGDENTLGGGNTATSVSVPPSGGVRRFKPGDEILGRYVVESELGQGGMGVVYKCLDKVGGVKVAVKGVPPDVAHILVASEPPHSMPSSSSDISHDSFC